MRFCLMWACAKFVLLPLLCCRYSLTLKSWRSTWRTTRTRRATSQRSNWASFSSRSTTTSRKARLAVVVVVVVVVALWRHSHRTACRVQLLLHVFILCHVFLSRKCVKWILFTSNDVTICVYNRSIGLSKHASWVKSITQLCQLTAILSHALLQGLVLRWGNMGGGGASPCQETCFCLSERIFCVNVRLWSYMYMYVFSWPTCVSFHDKSALFLFRPHSWTSAFPISPLPPVSLRIIHCSYVQSVWFVVLSSDPDAKTCRCTVVMCLCFSWRWVWYRAPTCRAWTCRARPTPTSRSTSCQTRRRSLRRKCTARHWTPSSTKRSRLRYVHVRTHSGGGSRCGSLRATELCGASTSMFVNLSAPASPHLPGSEMSHYLVYMHLYGVFCSMC